MNHYFESRKEVYVAQLATALSEFFKLNEQWITTKIMGNFAEFEIGKNTITLCINPVAAGGLEYNYLKHPPVCDTQ